MSTSSNPLSGQVGIVTGAGKGLGRAFALDLAAAGATVIVNNRNRQIDENGLGPADHVVAEISAAGGVAVAEYSDVSDPNAAETLVQLALERYGRIDFLVTNAAISGVAMFHKMTPAQFDAVTEINVGGTARLAMLCSREMRKAEFGRIVLIASTAGLHGEPTASAYSASKGAVIALGRAIAREGAPRNVLTNVVLPYATTQMTETGMNEKYRDVMTSEAVAPVVTALVDPESQLNGELLVCAAGGLRVAAAVEYGSVRLPANLSSAKLADLVVASRNRPPREFADAQVAFLDFAAEVTDD
ncbi:NAD(P)-dependent dehydrogenase, short-chain alcohol dehydrogenase family [Frankineae bacterium MT45]|nr:NAD(P)-dependent dehydrogenase, short-chain alcohol dehydrogenase family [Frankineae bacterium MT45]